ncbi:carbon catabolite repressor protein 4 homolog 4-like isoform X2 [Cucumis sativus]|uniref:carbon catabolite repressor protein 4 homolog 4-like isoform X2 n=1 Tax=Cucumis sativus TaxID=3659 RepID=UPI0012F519F7|nr:carbon catabolite repressor protein 4 homolog 4-like isoform X2 [Cucumis sativus]
MSLKNLKNSPFSFPRRKFTHSSSSKTTVADRGDPNDPRVRLKRPAVLKNILSIQYVKKWIFCYRDPEWADVKLAQAKYLLSRLARFKSLVAEKFECTPSVLLAGDFNSTPGDKVHIVLYTYVCNILKMGPLGIYDGFSETQTESQKVSFRQEDFGIITRLRLRYR